MQSKISLLRLILLFIFIFCTVNCSLKRATNHSELKEYINTINIIDTHEHQHNPADFPTQNHNFYYLLNVGYYLKADLVSAGASGISLNILENHNNIKNRNLDELWDIYGQYLNYSCNTTFYRQFLLGFKFLYDFDDFYFTKENIQFLSAEIEKNYNNYESWFDTAFKKAGYSIMFIDQYWNTLNTNINKNYYALVFNIGELVTSISSRPNAVKDDSKIQNVVFRKAKAENFTIKTLDDYLTYADHIFHQFLDQQMVCIKNALAYTRSLKFEDVSYERAKSLFAKKSSELNEHEKKELQDFMFHWIIKKSIEFDLPIQIHTGYLAGNGNTLENSRPTKLNNLFIRYPKAKFILFHGGYPWTGEYIALGKMFPNVYLDLVWLPQISREAAIRSLHEILDCVPYNKIFWGGDSFLIEESVGSLQMAKEVIFQVLSERLDKGYMTEEIAQDIALKIFRENAIKEFKLNERLGRDL